MKAAVMQPYFFPYLGYFQLINSVDLFVFFEDIQFKKKSWMVRNRILTKSSPEPIYINASIKKPKYNERLTKIKLVENWEHSFFLKLANYSKAKYFDETIEFLKNEIDYRHEYLSDFNVSSIKLISKYLKIENEFNSTKNINFDFEEQPEKGTWGYLISKHFNAGAYINAPGGESFILETTFNNMKLGFIQPKLNPYNQLSNKWVSGLSILDVLFNIGLENTRNELNKYKIKFV